MDNVAAEKEPRLKDTDKGVDFWCLAVLPEHRGKKIANNLIRAALMLQEATNNTFATITAMTAILTCPGIFEKMIEIYSFLLS